MKTLNLNFTHPQYGTIFNADVDTGFTAAELLENLVLSGFIPENQKGYQLALREQIMQAKQPLATLDGLADGVVLRIITAKEETKAMLQFFVRHPRTAEYAPINIYLEENGQQFIERLLTQGFLAEITEGLAIYFKGTALDMQLPLASQNLPTNAYLELRDAHTQSPDLQLRSLLLAVDSLQSNTQNKLQEILDYLPPPSAIPIDPERAVNPTLDAYESTDTLVAELHKMMGRPAPKKIRIWSPIPWVFGALLLLALLILIILFATGVL